MLTILSAPAGKPANALTDAKKRGKRVGLNFDDVTGITPGDEDAYARVLIGLWQDPGLWQNADGGETMRRFLKERCVPDAAAQWVYDAAQWAYDGCVVANARSEGLDSRVFSGWSNADGSMVDYYASGVVAGIVRGDTDFAHERTLRLALRHPRAWGVTVEKVYTVVEPTLRMLASVMGSPACPEWVWEDALARSGRLLALSDNYVFVKTERVFDAAWLSGRHARRLLDAGLAYYAVFVACASPGALVRVADFALARSPVWKWLLRDVAAHRNTPPEVRRELVRWFPESLWLVARDGFLGRARLQK